MLARIEHNPYRENRLRSGIHQGDEQECPPKRRWVAELLRDIRLIFKVRIGTQSIPLKQPNDPNHFPLPSSDSLRSLFIREGGRGTQVIERDLIATLFRTSDQSFGIAIFWKSEGPLVGLVHWRSLCQFGKFICVRHTDTPTRLRHFQKQRGGIVGCLR